MDSGLTGYVTNAVWAIIGALGSKLGTQAVLGSNNTGIMGYAGNLAVGAGLWLLTEKMLRNREASKGVVTGTMIQVIIRAINDFTPFGSYVQQLGMGDYMVQSYVTPQVLVDPWNNAQIAIPNGWAPTTVVAPATAAAGGGTGMSGYDYGTTYGMRGSGVY